ncbi:MAG TPA: type I pantothenate kinase [Microbacteriaceae bacterium]
MNAVRTGVSPYIEIERSEWAELGYSLNPPMTEAELNQIRGLGDFLDLDEVREVYLPLSRLLNMYAQSERLLHKQSADYFGPRASKTPFVIGIAGSVAVGKSTVSRVLEKLLSRWPETPKVELITTDGFLYPNAELEAKGLMLRKGFPESYDIKALMSFISDIKSGVSEVSAPVYDHLTYDIIPGAQQVVHNPDVLIIEGLNLLQPPQFDQELALSDFLDFGIYVDADYKNIEKWFISRFEQLWRSAFTDPKSYFHDLTKTMNQEQAIDRAVKTWREINLPNLKANILPTKNRATAVLQKGNNHRVESVLLRKV